MSKHPDTVYWLEQPQWLFVGGSSLAAVVALIAEGPGQYVGFLLLLVCVLAICAWSLTGKPSLVHAVWIVTAAMLLLGWTVEEPESALFQPVLISAAVGWRIDRLSHSIILLLILVLLPLLGSLGPYQADWGWWNWSVGTLFTWTLGRVIRLLEQTLNELAAARSQLVDSAASSAAREERLRISRDVHDLVGHSLTAMLLNIRAARRTLDSNLTDAKLALADAESIGTTGIADIRAALADMRGDGRLGSNSNEALSSVPDGEAILQLLDRQEHIAVSISGDVMALHGPLAIGIYRILQECITNISKHATGATGSITVVVQPNEISINAVNKIRVTQLSDTNPTEKTLGLISMRERASILGGSFSAGAQGLNWQVTCCFPRHD